MPTGCTTRLSVAPAIVAAYETVTLRVVFHKRQRVWLLSRDHVKIESTCLVQRINIALGERRRHISSQILVLDVEVELRASATEYRSEEDDEEKWESYGPEYVALATIPALEMPT